MKNGVVSLTKKETATSTKPIDDQISQHILADLRSHDSRIISARINSIVSCGGSVALR